MVEPVKSVSTVAAKATTPTNSSVVTFDQLLAKPEMRDLFVMTILNSMIGINSMLFDMTKRALDDGSED